MKTMLVTGGCGFIGSHFIREIVAAARWRVVNLDKLTYAGNLENVKGIAEGEGYRFVRGDICDRTLIEALYSHERPATVVNFAAESHVDRSILDSTPFLETNTLGMQVLLEGARKHNVERFVQLSTDEVYGDLDRLSPSDEEHPLAPSSPYAASKAAADLLALAYCRTYGLPVVIVRSCNNYGPFQFPEKLIPLMIRNILVGKDLPIYGDGMQQREWIYVDDNVDAIAQVIERGRVGEIYNVSTEDEQTNRDVVRLLCDLMADEVGVDVKSLHDRVRFVIDRPGHDRRYAMKAAKIRTQLGWEPRVSLDMGLRRSIRWYFDNQPWLDNVTSGAYRQYYDAVYARAGA